MEDNLKFYDINFRDDGTMSWSVYDKELEEDDEKLEEDNKE